MVCSFFVVSASAVCVLVLGIGVLVFTLSNFVLNSNDYMCVVCLSFVVPVNYEYPTDLANLRSIDSFVWSCKGLCAFTSALLHKDIVSILFEYVSQL